VGKRVWWSNPPKDVEVPVAEVPPEASAVPLADWCELARAARVFYRRATNGRLDSEWFERAREGLELRLQKLPESLWRVGAAKR
jgi:hypothetical protein